MPGYGHSARARVFGPEERVLNLFLRSLSGPGLTAQVYLGVGMERCSCTSCLDSTPYQAASGKPQALQHLPCSCTPLDPQTPKN